MNDAVRRPLRAVVVGAGLMGRWHAHAVTRARVGRVVAIVDPDVARARTLATRHHGARVAATLGEAIDAVDGGADVVHVCAPLAAHASLVRAALAHGAHVIVEKPVAADAAETAALLALAAEHARLLVPVHQFLFQRGVLGVLRALPSLGTLLHVDATACTAGAAGLPPAAQDRVALEVLPHPLSLVARLVSPALLDAPWRVRHAVPGELRVDGVLDAVTVSLLVSTGGRPTANELRLVGTLATAHVDLFHGFATIHRAPTTRAAKMARPFVAASATLAAAAGNLARRAAAREPAYPGLRELVRRTYAAACDGTAAPISDDETLAVARTMDVVRAAMTLPAARTPRVDYAIAGGAA